MTAYNPRHLCMCLANMLDISCVKEATLKMKLAKLLDIQKVGYRLSASLAGMNWKKKKKKIYVIGYR